VLVIGSQSVLGSFADDALVREGLIDLDILSDRIGTVAPHPLVIEKIRVWIASNRRDQR
jgi:hypothetical protein